jgi:hypothetical protein
MNAIETTLKQLRLSGLIQTLDVRLQEAAAKSINAAIAQYNATLGSFPNSYLGKRQGFEPIGFGFDVVGGETY